MAYLKECRRTCDTEACIREAVVEVITTRNALFGYYCRKHGQAIVERLTREEAPKVAHGEGRGA